MAIDDDAVFAAALRVHDRGQAVSALRVALELEWTGDRPDEIATEEALRRLVDAGRLLHSPAIVEWVSVPESRKVLDFYLPVPDTSARPT